MPEPLILENVTSGSASATIGMLESIADGDKIVLGREVDSQSGILLKSTGVSREHGMFIGCGSQWLYKDLESTNGSWLNGKKLEGGKLTIVRAGDVLQLGDIGLKLVSAGDGFTQSGNSGRVVLVFSRGEFFKEFPVPPFGRALSVGGANADLSFDSNVEELPALVVEGRGEHVSAVSVSPRIPYFVNEEQKSTNTVLKDRDEIRIAHFRIILSDPGRPKDLTTATYENSSTIAPAQRGDRRGNMAHFEEHSAVEPRQSVVGSGGLDWEGLEAVPKTQVKLPFGQTGRGEFETTALSTAELESRFRGSEIHPALRRGLNEEPEDNYERIEDKVILVIGGILLVAVIVMFILWWVL